MFCQAESFWVMAAIETKWGHYREVTPPFPFSRLGLLGLSNLPDGMTNGVTFTCAGLYF
jgi:hypothetical protein